MIGKRWAAPNRHTIDMPFQKGNKLGKPGNRGGGRPKKEVGEIQKAAADLARDYIERSVKPVMATYFQLAHGRLVNKWHEGLIVGQEFEADAATTRHFVDKLIPDEQVEAQRPININFVRFDNTVQLSAAGVPVTILAGDDNGHQEIGEGVASSKRQGQVGPKFLDFTDVPGERR